MSQLIQSNYPRRKLSGKLSNSAGPVLLSRDFPKKAVTQYNLF